MSNTIVPSSNNPDVQVPQDPNPVGPPPNPLPPLAPGLSVPPAFVRTTAGAGAPTSAMLANEDAMDVDGLDADGMDIDGPSSAGAASVDGETADVAADHQWNEQLKYDDIFDGDGFAHDDFKPGGRLHHQAAAFKNDYLALKNLLDAWKRELQTDKDGRPTKKIRNQDYLNLRAAFDNFRANTYNMKGFREALSTLLPTLPRRGDRSGVAGQIHSSTGNLIDSIDANFPGAVTVSRGGFGNLDAQAPTRKDPNWTLSGRPGFSQSLQGAGA